MFPVSRRVQKVYDQWAFDSIRFILAQTLCADIQQRIQGVVIPGSLLLLIFAPSTCRGSEWPTRIRYQTNVAKVALVGMDCY